MSSAAIHGKVARNEDALTACFVDLLRIHEDRSLVDSLLRSASIVRREGTPSPENVATWLADVVWDRFDIELWPRWSSGEPDAVLELYDGPRRVARVVIEAKAGAAKSGDGDERGTEGIIDPVSGDQLAAYLYDAALDAGPGTRVALIYLTHHVTAPRSELSDSIAARERRGAQAPIAWSAWRDVEAALVERVDAPGPLGRAIRDGIQLLRLYGYARFRGRWRFARVATFGAAQPGSIWRTAPRPSPSESPPLRNRTWTAAPRPRPVPRIVFWGARSEPARTFRPGSNPVRRLPPIVFRAKEPRHADRRRTPDAG